VWGNANDLVVVVVVVLLLWVKAEPLYRSSRTADLVSYKCFFNFLYFVFLILCYLSMNKDV